MVTNITLSYFLMMPLAYSTHCPEGGTVTAPHLQMKKYRNVPCQHRRLLRRHCGEGKPEKAADWNTCTFSSLNLTDSGGCQCETGFYLHL